MTKNRPPSRLLSWISQWTHRSSTTANDDDDDDDDDDGPTPALIATKPINVPTKRRPSVSLSVAGTIDDSIYTSSSIHSSSFPTSSIRRPSATSNVPDASLTRLGQSFPEKRPPQDHRPSSVLSLPSSKARPNRHDLRPPRASLDTCKPIPRSRAQYKANAWPRTDRMIIRQELLRLALDGLYSSPVRLSDPSKHIRVLHIGCGNGAWCIAMAKKYKHAFVLGIDERDVLDRRISMPTNFRFMCAQEDILADLKRLPDDQFDFIYGRFLIFSFRPDQYRDIVQECWRLCKPLGYMEMMELDMKIYGNPQAGPMSQRMNTQVMYLMEQRSLDPCFARHLQDIFFFHQLVEQMQQQHGDAYHSSHTSLPLGLWGGRIGVMFRDDLHDLIELIHTHEQHLLQPTLFVNDDPDDDGSFNPWTDQKLATTLERIDEEFESRWAFMNLHHVYARKL